MNITADNHNEVKMCRLILVIIIESRFEAFKVQRLTIYTTDINGLLNDRSAIDKTRSEYELEGMEKQAVLGYFDMLCWYLPGGTKEKQMEMGKDVRCPS
jgi:hypothetical protein